LAAKKDANVEIFVFEAPQIHINGSMREISLADFPFRILANFTQKPPY
jgi:hypothetical protein